MLYILTRQANAQLDKVNSKNLTVCRLGSILHDVLSYTSPHPKLFIPIILAVDDSPRDNLCLYILSL